MRHYWTYLKYILEHKLNVFRTCWNRGLYLHAFTHDLSKFSPKEFFAYANYFYKDKDMYQKDFNKAWEHHYTHNPHHWQYWVYNGKPMDMPQVYVEQMIADWEAMAIKFGGNATDFYLSKYKEIKITPETKRLVLRSLVRREA